MDENDHPPTLDYRSANNDELKSPSADTAKRIVSALASLAFGSVAILLWIAEFQTYGEYIGGAVVTTIGCFVCGVIGFSRSGRP